MSQLSSTPPKCGICRVEGQNKHVCVHCRVAICENCNVIILMTESGPSYIRRCVLCDEIESRNSSSFKFYCYCCDTRMLWYSFIDKCGQCALAGKTEFDRKLLPHYKARDIIEIHYIPEIAKLIFDYYYIPRRYFEGEF